MATKKVDANVSTDTLADIALDDTKEMPAVDVFSGAVGMVAPVINHTRYYGYSLSNVPLAPVDCSVTYPENKTDQLHALSVSEMIRQGQGAVMADPDNFDANLPGDPKSLYETDWADPAERYESEVALNEQFVKSIHASRRDSDQSVQSDESDKSDQSEHAE